MTARCLVLLGAIAAAGAVGIPGGAGAESPRAVIELFTSQGCSACPAADKLLGELKNDPSLVALSLSVDYWDYVGWKDTLADPRHTARQKAYSQMRGDREIYTPQVVVNGTVHALGSDRAAIERAVAWTRRNPATLSVPLTVSVANGKVTVTAPAAKTAGQSGEVWLCLVAKSVPVAIGRGENRGRTITYNNVVREWIKLGTWTGHEQTWTVPLADIADIKASGADAVTVMIQSGSPEKPGAMLGAAMASLR